MLKCKFQIFKVQNIVQPFCIISNETLFRWCSSKWWELGLDPSHKAPYFQPFKYNLSLFTSRQFHDMILYCHIKKNIHVVSNAWNFIESDRIFFNGIGIVLNWIVVFPVCCTFVYFKNCRGNLHFLPQYVLTEKLAELDLIRDHRITNNQAEKQEWSPKLSHYCGCWRKWK